MLWLLVVPSKLTWLLQPLDVYGFSQLKLRFREGYQRAVLAGDKTKPAVRMIRIIIEQLTFTLQRQPWRRYFRRLGFWDNQTCVSKFIRKQLQIDGVAALSSESLPEERLALCWPSNRNVRYADIAAALPPLPLPAAAAAMAGLPMPIEAAETPAGVKKLSLSPHPTPAEPHHVALVPAPPVLLRRLSSKQRMPDPP